MRFSGAENTVDSLRDHNYYSSCMNAIITIANDTELCSVCMCGRVDKVTASDARGSGYDSGSRRGLIRSYSVGDCCRITIIIHSSFSEQYSYTEQIICQFVGAGRRPCRRAHTRYNWRPRRPRSYRAQILPSGRKHVAGR